MVQRVSVRSTRRRDAMQVVREGNYAHARCVVTGHCSCLTGANLCLISFRTSACKGTDVFEIERSVTFFLPLIANSVAF
jgi:hypothetical protein